MSPAVLGFDPLRPGLSWLALAAPLVLAFGLVALAARRRARERLVAARHQARFLPRFSVGRARLRLACAALATLFLALAALGPVRGYTLREVARRGLDLVVCVDTSRSMLVQDIKPDRLTRAKREVTGLLQRLEDDRAALLAFAGDVRSVAPLTHDRMTLGIFVDTLNTEENLQGGTDIGGVLERALELFDGRTGAHEAIVLITDGEDLEGRGLELAGRAAERGIKVFIVGMATEGGGKIPTERGFVRDDTGSEVVSRLDGTSLAAIADLTGGSYMSAETSPLPLEELFEKRISKLEGRELFSGKERIPHDRFQWPLVLAALCMLLEVGLRERRGRTRSERRAERSARGVKSATAAAQAAAGLALVLWLAAARAPQGASAPGASAPASAAVPAEPPTADVSVRIAPELWSGSLADGLAEVERRVAARETERALALTDGLSAPTPFASWRLGLAHGRARAALDLGTPLWDALGWSGLDERQRAAIELTRGLVLTHGLDVADAVDAGRREAFAHAAERAFQAARAGAGRGALRLDATYDLGTLDLLEGERQRALLPEVSGGQAPPPAAPPMPGTTGAQPGAQPAAQPGAQEEPPDPLELAREAYLAARDHFVERLREDWRDADTQADVELVQRRLRELDEIERKREEQEQQQDQQQQQDQKDGEQQQQQDPQDGDQQNQPPDEQEQEQPQEPEEQEQEQEQDPADEQQENGGEPEEQELEERLLTKEEVQRLLDRLQQIENEGERVRKQLMHTRRAKVDKDW